MSPSFEPDGILIINKHSGPTSHDIVNMIRKLYHTKKVGHTGTLDPMATGVLVVLVGRAAKAAEFLVSDEKKYSAVMRLGLTTDTEDITGKLLSEFKGPLPSFDEVEKACEGFIGKSKQIPPMYSALKVDGRKLVDMARRGEKIEREARAIEIYSIDCKQISDTDFALDVHASSGTYIRSLCRDIGEKLGCGATMTALTRTETGGFPISESITIDQLKGMEEDRLWAKLIPTEELFSSLPRVILPPFYEKLCRSGCEIYQKKIKTSFDVASRVRICSESGEFFALGEIKEYEGGSAIKAIKTFKL